MRGIVFTETEREEGAAFYREKKVVSILFSGGTYQIEVQDQGVSFWPFLQMDDEGDISDSFCTCGDSSHCSHLAGAYLAVFGGTSVPLHRRFADSFWNKICRIVGHEHGYRNHPPVKNKDWEIRRSDGNLLFSFRPLKRSGESLAGSLFEETGFETEETSLKFSGRTEEEIRLWKEGNPGEDLAYELSFWFELAKELFLKQEQGEEYRLEFFPKKTLPLGCMVEFVDLRCEWHWDESDISKWVSSLKTVTSPLRVFETEDLSVASIEYDPNNRCFHLRKKIGVSEKDDSKGKIVLDGWSFVPEKGFFRFRSEHEEFPDVVPEKEMEEFLQRHFAFVKKHLPETFDDAMRPLRYRLSVTKDLALTVTTYLFSEEDFSFPESVLFGRWAYIRGRGFFFVSSSPFSSPCFSVPKEKVSDFVKKYASWLNGIEGFSVRLSCIESIVSYRFDTKGTLCFFSAIDFDPEEEEPFDFGDWVFWSGRGFFPKKKEEELTGIFSGKRVEEREIASFIRRHAKELHWVPRFFAVQSPVESVAFSFIVSENRVYVEPEFSLTEEYRDIPVRFFGEYAYVEGEGFSRIECIPLELEKYIERRALSEKEVLTLHDTFRRAGGVVVKADPGICIPERLETEIVDMERKEQHWAVALSYTTDLGRVDGKTVWEAVSEGKKFLLSDAGFLDLTSERFAWLKGFGKRRWETKKNSLTVSAVDWIRLQMQEGITLSADAAPSVRTAFSEFREGTGFRPLVLDGLQSTLRGYQETGVRWLWFLYCYGMSGILCDEMGLGKTHQAMALLAAVTNGEPGEKKFLVVCPTSVIYHWQRLLSMYVPSLRVAIFHGQGRSRQRLPESYDVLVTSYGMIRLEKELFEKEEFAVAIYDELQQAKNPRSRVHRALKSLTVKTGIGLTGTPIENSVIDIKSLFDLLLPGYFPSDAVFKERFLFPIEKEGNVEKKQLLGKAIRPFVLRRRKKEVLSELPDKVEEIAYCDLSEEQKLLYREVVTGSKALLYEEIESGKLSSQGLHIFAVFSKLKQICDHPSLITGRTEDYPLHVSGKWDLFTELLEEAGESGQKVVVFSQYLKMLDIIKAYLKGRGVEYAEIRGSTRDRGGELSRFRDDPECRVFLGSLQAAGVGIDLTAASVVIHYDRWWNPAKENQATDRVHRIGQTRGVQVFKLVTKHTIEEKIDELINRKVGMLEDVVGFDDRFLIKHFTKEELLELLSSMEEIQ